MLAWQNDRINVSKGVGVEKTIASKECDICHYRHSVNYILSFNQMTAIDVTIYYWCL